MGEIDLSEYDAFGPWIIEFYSKELLPKLFVNKIDMNIHYDFLIKIPREIERRIANPNMDLYDYIIGIAQTKMYIYERIGKKVKETIIDLTEIQSIKSRIELLYGKIDIQLKERTLKIRYNTVSSEMITRMISIIRKYYNTSKQDLPEFSIDEKEIEQMGYYYKSILGHIKKQEKDLKFIAWQPIKKLEYANHNFLRRWMLKRTKTGLLSCLYGTNNKELIIIKKGRYYFRKAYVDYSHYICFIPFDRINSISQETSNLTPEVEKIILDVGNEHFDLLFDKNNKYQQPLFETIQNIIKK